MITIKGKQYPNTKEFAKITGVSVRTLNRFRHKHPWVTIKWSGQRLRWTGVTSFLKNDN